MASDAKIRANRANAQKSTGPRTAAGKDRSRLNATRHNITGIPSLRSGPEKDAFDAYFERLIPGFHATNDVEFELAGRIVDVMFRLARISTLEVNILNAGESAAAAPLTDADRALAQANAFIRESRTFSNLSLYEQRLSRTLQKDLDTLQFLRNPKQSKGIVAPSQRPHVVRWVSDDPDPVDTLPPVHFSAQPVVRVPGESLGFVISSSKPNPAPPGKAA
jgi:hypothetical protein